MSEQQPQSNSIRPRAEILLWVMPVLAAILMPGLNWMVAERPMAARISLASTMTVIVALVALVFFAVYSRGFRHRIRWSLALTAITTLVLFQWPMLSIIGKLLALRLPIPMLTDLFPVVAAIAFLWVATRLGHERAFAAITTAGLWLIVVALAVGSMQYITQPATASRAAVAPPDAPDVLLIIMDGYPRGDILETEFDFDNAPFLSDLEDLGFIVADRARPNYSFTYASVSTMLEMDYVYDLGEISLSEQQAMRDALTGDPMLFKMFRDHGYEVGYVENAWSGSRCSPLVDVCILDGLVERAVWNVGQVTILAPVVGAFRGHPFNTVSRGHLETLPHIVETDRTEGTPRLTIAHLLLPHPPLLLNPDCEVINTPTRRAFMADDAESLADRRQFYREQMTCSNMLLLDSLTEIIAQDEDIVVMVTADHGTGSTLLANIPGSEWSDEAMTERMSILSAYRLPGCEEDIYPSITPVNGVRAMASCSLGIDLERLPDWSWWAPGNGAGVITDESDRLQR